MVKLIFDFDGVLVDSMPFNTQAVVSVLDLHSIPYSRREVVADVTALSRSGIAHYLKERFGVTESEADIVAHIDLESGKAYRACIPAKESVPETLATLRQAGYSLSVLTATPHPLVDDCLKRLGLYDLFDFVWSCDDFGTSKNDPAIFCAAAERLGAKVSDCMMADDNITALTSAKKAGMQIVEVYDDTSSCLEGQIRVLADAYVYRMRDLLPVVESRTPKFDVKEIRNILNQPAAAEKAAEQ